MKDVLNKTKTIITQLWLLVVLLAKIASAYVFTTQDDIALMVVGGILGLSAGFTLIDKFINEDK